MQEVTQGVKKHNNTLNFLKYRARRPDQSEIPLQSSNQPPVLELSDISDILKFNPHAHIAAYGAGKELCGRLQGSIWKAVFHE